MTVNEIRQTDRDLAGWHFAIEAREVRISATICYDQFHQPDLLDIIVIGAA